MDSDAEVEIHRVPHGAQLAFAQTNFAVIEVVHTTRGNCLAADAFFDDIGSLVSFFARVDDDFLAPHFSGAT